MPSNATAPFVSAAIAPGTPNAVVAPGVAVVISGGVRRVAHPVPGNRSVRADGVDVGDLGHGFQVVRDGCRCPSVDPEGPRTD